MEEWSPCNSRLHAHSGLLPTSLMEIATKKCFIEHSVQFEEYQVHDPQPAEEGLITPSNPFADNDSFTNISDSKYEEEDRDDRYL